MSDDQPDKKLHVDEDWKSQVEAEKQAACQPADSPKPAEKPASSESRGSLPPADLGFLIGTLYIQGAMSLGLLPNPMTKQAAVDRPRAQHAIDLLAMLQQKTEGNRTPEEDDAMEAALHELRMAYVQTRN